VDDYPNDRDRVVRCPMTAVTVWTAESAV